MSKTTYIAAYLPALPEGVEDPSKGGFETEDDAWDWILENGQCDRCKLMYKKEGFSPCEAEWTIFEEE